MPIYSVEDHGGQGVLSEYKTPGANVLSLAVEDAFADNISTKLYQAGMNREQDNGGIISKAEAMRQAKQAGVDLNDIPDEGISSAALPNIIERQYQKKRRREAIDAAGGGFRNGAVELTGNLLGSLVDPLNIAAAFVPVVGEAKYASMLAKAAGPMGRAGVRATVGAAEGAVGTAALEPFNYGLSQQLEDDYTAMNTIMNIGFGGVLGAGLHTGAGAIKEAVMGGYHPSAAPPVGRTSEIMTYTPPEARNDMARTVLAQLLEDRKVDVNVTSKAHYIEERAALAKQIDPDAFPELNFKQEEWNRLERSEHQSKLKVIETERTKIQAAANRMEELGVNLKNKDGTFTPEQLLQMSEELDSIRKQFEIRRHSDLQSKADALQAESDRLMGALDAADGGKAELQRRQAKAFAMAEEKIKQKLKNEASTPEQREARARELDPEAHDSLNNFDARYKEAEAKLARLYKELESVPESTRQVADIEALTDEIDTATQEFKALDQERAGLQKRVAEAKRKADIEFTGKPYTPTPEDVRVLAEDQPNSRMIDSELEAKHQAELDEIPAETTIDDIKAMADEEEAALADMAEQAEFNHKPMLKEAEKMIAEANEFEKAIKAMAKCAMRKS
jgi:chorismate mutase